MNKKTYFILKLLLAFGQAIVITVAIMMIVYLSYLILNSLGVVR